MFNYVVRFEYILHVNVVASAGAVMKLHVNDINHGFELHVLFGVLFPQGLVDGL